MIRFIPFLIVVALLGLSFWGAQSVTWLYGVVAIFGALVLVGLFDLIQTRHTLLRNFPLLGRLRGGAAAPLLPILHRREPNRGPPVQS